MGNILNPYGFVEQLYTNGVDIDPGAKIHHIPLKQWSRKDTPNALIFKDLMELIPIGYEGIFEFEFTNYSNTLELSKKFARSPTFNYNQKKMGSIATSYSPFNIRSAGRLMMPGDVVDSNVVHVEHAIDYEHNGQWPKSEEKWAKSCMEYTAHDQNLYESKLLEANSSLIKVDHNRSLGNKWNVSFFDFGCIEIDNACEYRWMGEGAEKFITFKDIIFNFHFGSKAQLSGLKLWYIRPDWLYYKSYENKKMSQLSTNEEKMWISHGGSGMNPMELITQLNMTFLKRKDKSVQAAIEYEIIQQILKILCYIYLYKHYNERYPLADNPMKRSSLGYDEIANADLCKEYIRILCKFKTSNVIVKYLNFYQ